MLWRVISLYARPKTPRTGHLASTASSIHPFVSCISYTPSSVCSGVQPVLTPPITPGWLPHVLAAASGVKIVAASLAQMMGSHSHGVRSEMKTVSDILTGVGAGTVCGRMYCTVLYCGWAHRRTKLRRGFLAPGSASLGGFTCVHQSPTPRLCTTAHRAGLTGQVSPSWIRGVLGDCTVRT
jgi:hypothetical protein